MKIGGIANVCTLPEYRGKGVATALLNKAHEIMEKNGVAIAGLLSEPCGATTGLYKKIGYDTIALLTESVGRLDRVIESLSDMPMAPNLRTRNYEEGDERRLLRIYAKETRNLAGSVKRDARYWRIRYKQVFSYNGFFFKKFDAENIIVLEGSKRISGYSFNIILGGVGYITELLAQKPYCENAKALLSSSLKYFASRNVRSLSLFCPKGTAITKCLKSLLGNELVENHVEAYMLKILSPQRTLEAIRDELRARSLVQPRLDIILELTLDGKSTFLSIRGEKVEIEDKIPGQRKVTKISITEQGFVGLIFGVSSIRNLRSQGHICCSTDELHLLSKLFPRKTCCLFPGDLW
jgi:predicted acetyltransferase